LPEAEAEEADTQLADSLKVPPGLVRVLRRIPRDEFDTLSQNVLGDDGRRRGSDGVTRTVPAKEQGEPEAPLFDGAEEMPVQTTQNILAEDAPPPIQVTDRRPVHLDDESSDATPETEQAAVVSAAEAPAASADSEDIQPLTNLKKGHKIAVCDTCGKGFPDVQIKEDEGFTCSACHGDERTAVREEAQETAGARQQSPALTVADLRDALRQGPLSRLQLEDLGFESPLINSAVASGDVAQPEIGKFSLPADPPPVQAGGEKKVSIQELLKGRPLTLSFVFLPTLQGKVSVSVNAGGKPETALRGLLDEAAARNFSEPVQELIVAALKKAAPAKSGSKAGQTKGTAKAAAKKSSKKAATKTAAKKSSSKSKSKSARA
jgi:ribonuclease E